MHRRCAACTCRWVTTAYWYPVEKWELVELSPIRKTDNMPDWITGYMSWRGADIPLVAMERALEKSFATRRRPRPHCSHAYSPSPQPGDQAYGIVIQRLDGGVGKQAMLTSSRTRAKSTGLMV